MKRLVIFTIGVVVVVGLATKVWYSEALKPTGGGEAAVVVQEGQTTESIAKALKDKNLIRSTRAFAWHTRAQGLAKEFKSGRFVLSGQQPTPELAKALTDRSRATSQFTLAEGLTQRQMAERLDKLDIVSAAEFGKLKVRDFPDYDFLAEVPDDASLEGFLFPETYEIPPAGADAKAVAAILLDQFGEELTPELRSAIARSGRTLYETVIVASIVEREVRNDADRRLVAGVFYARMEKGMSLGADATTRYGLNKLTEPLTRDDLASDNPYNTRKVKGLPPGPIANPGLSALRAAINPESSDFLYYLSAKDGKTIFAVTLEEHEANIEKFLR